MEFKDKKVAVLGAGVEGVSSAKFLAGKGARVTVLDRREIKEVGGIRVIGGEDYLKGIDQYDVVVRSPGVKRNIAEIVDAEKSGVTITSQTKIFFDLCPCPIIGVTGTKGKGTTASLIYEMLKIQGANVYLGGNIGTPPLDFLDKVKKDSWVVLELSSFQLLDLGFQSQRTPVGLLKETPYRRSHLSQTATSEVNFGKPHIAVMLMVVPEHLNYHKDVYEYVEAKRNILKFQTASDFAILNKDYPAANEADIYTEGKVFYVSRERKVEEGCFVREGKIIVSRNGAECLTYVANNACISTSLRSSCQFENSSNASQVPYGNLASVPASRLRSTRDTPRLRRGLVKNFSHAKAPRDYCHNHTKEKIIETEIIDTQDILLPGKHNWENVCASVMAATLAGVEKANIVKVLKTFKGLEHRLELVGEVEGVKYYDDSFSTTPETAIAAIQAFKQPEILILGGSSKRSDFTELGKVISEAENIKAVIGIGEEWGRIKAQFRVQSLEFKVNEKAKHLGGVMASPSTPLGISLPPSEVDGKSETLGTIQIYEGLKTMQEVIQKTSEIAKPGDVVLLSPACASFGMFKNYKDRGEQFKKEVKNLH